MNLSALESVFEEEGQGPSLEHQPVTIRAVLKLLEAWKPGPSAELAARLQEMRERVLGAARSTEEDLQLDRDPELEGYLEELLTVYVEMASSLRAGEKAIEAQDAAQVEAATTRLRGLLERLRAQDAAVTEWNGREIPRCPRCGRSGDATTSCTACGLELLYYDPTARNPREARFGPEYSTVQEAWNAVAAGEATLNTLWPTLQPLETLLRRYLRMAQQELSLGLAGERVQAALERIATASQGSLDGLARMRRAEASRRLFDLHEGWAIVISEGLVIQESIPQLSRALGGKPTDTAVSTQDELAIDFD
jgi:hypothetical protein